METKITVQSSTTDLGEALPRHARQSIERVTGKYFGQLTSAAVHFTREGSNHRCIVNVHMNGTQPVTGEALNDDAFQAFNMALEKTAKQLRRKKRAVREDKAIRTDKDALLRDGSWVG
jgi:ribosomal subunit interface protein